MKVYINYNDARWRKYKIDFEQIASAAAKNLGSDAEVSIVLTNDSEIHRLNREYRNIDKPTNVLSFELDDDILLGDIYISLDTAQAEADAENISLADHVAHLVVHGMLHLQGYDHIRDSDAIVMEKAEVDILKTLGIKNPYVQDSGVYSDFSSCPGDRFLSRIKRIKFRENGFWQYVVMALLGGAGALGFAPYHLWWMTLISIVAVYMLSVRAASRRPGMIGAFLRVLPFSAVYAVAMFWWVTHSIYVVPELTSQFAIWTIPALIGIGIVGGIVFAIPFVVIMRMCTFPPCRPFLFAAMWTLVLWLREWVFTGFPWNPIANITLTVPVISNSMALWGALGLTFVVIGFMAAFSELLMARKNKYNWIVLGVFAILLVIGMIAGYRNIQLAHLVNNGTSPVIRIVQPAQSQSQKIGATRADAVRVASENVRNLINLASAPGNPNIVVFPETSYPFAIVDNDNMPIANVLRRNVIIGANYFSDGKLYNSMVVAGTDGEIEKIYSKSHLVPFGEYRPFGDIIPTPGQLEAGTGAEIINVDGFSFAPAICYEIIFSDSLVPDNETPDAIINITNDTWFGNTPGTYQHLDMVRRYAIESGLPIVRANYSGISAFVSSDGDVLTQIPVANVGYMDGVVYGAHITPYRKIGRDGCMIIILLFSCMCTFTLRRAILHK